ncbi:MAG TPA: hypothetical protein VGO60_07555 [Iamia sp.]|nr:hypothetical protein [Iamia sp.]
MKIIDLAKIAAKQVGRAATWLWSGAGLIVVALALVLWWAGVFGWFYLQDTATSSDCANGTKEIQAESTAGAGAGTENGDDPDAPAATATSTLTAPESFDFTSRRDAQTHVIPIEVEGEVPDVSKAEVVVDGFDGPAGAPAIDAVYDLRAVGSGLVLEVCIDSRPLKVSGETVARKKAPGIIDWLRGTADTRPGTYTTNVHIVQDGVATEPIPIQVRFQGRYIWLLAPLVLFMPALAISIVYSKTPPDGWWLVYFTTLGATAVAFNAQALSDPDWGGIVACFGLVGATFTSAVAAATLAAKTPTSD